MLALPEDTGAKWKEISAPNGQSGDNLSDTIQYHYIINKQKKNKIKKASITPYGYLQLI